MFALWHSYLLKYFEQHRDNLLGGEDFNNTALIFLIDPLSGNPHAIAHTCRHIMFFFDVSTAMHITKRILKVITSKCAPVIAHTSRPAALFSDISIAMQIPRRILEMIISKYTRAIAHTRCLTLSVTLRLLCANA